MDNIIKELTPIARKVHHCNASDWLVNGYIEPGELTIKELRAIIKARRNNYKIQVGERYIRTYDKARRRFVNV